VCAPRHGSLGSRALDRARQPGRHGPARRGGGRSRTRVSVPLPLRAAAAGAASRPGAPSGSRLLRPWPSPCQIRLSESSDQARPETQQQHRSRPQDPKRHQWLKPPDAMRSCSPARPRSPGSGSVPAAVSLTGSMGGGTLPRFASRHPQPKKPSSSACRSGRPAARPGASPKRHATARRYVAAKERPAFFYCCSHHGTHPFFIFYSIFWLVTVKITLDASSLSPVSCSMHACYLYFGSV